MNQIHILVPMTRSFLLWKQLKPMSLRNSHSVGVDGTGYPACKDVKHQTKSTYLDSLLIKHPSNLSFLLSSL